MTAADLPAPTPRSLGVGAGAPGPMPPETATWIYDNVIGNYHWAVWRTDWRDSTPANERNLECEPSHIDADEPISARVCFCQQRMCTLVGPGRIRKNWADGYLYRHYAVWLAHARDRYAPQTEPEPAPDPPVQVKPDVTAEPPPFTDDRAAWIREHAWTPRMRKTHREVPRFYLTCACQYGATAWCQTGQHDRCGRGEPLRSYETLICSRGGEHPALFLEPFTHKTDVSATGPRRTQDAMVWLADRVCRWVCPCACHSAPPPPAAPVQDVLFEVSA